MDSPNAPLLYMDNPVDDDDSSYRGTGPGGALAGTCVLFGVKHHLVLVAVRWHEQDRTVTPYYGQNPPLQRIIDQVLRTDPDVYGWAPGDAPDQRRHEPAFIRVPDYPRLKYVALISPMTRGTQLPEVGE